MERNYPVNLRISDRGLALIGEFEGCILYAYDDANPKHGPIKPGEEVKGTLTIGYGHTRTAKPGMRITADEALTLLRTDVREAESYVHRFVKCPLSQNEFDGLVSIIFNVGPGRVRGSTGPTDDGKAGIIVLANGEPSSLLKCLNKSEPDYETAAGWFTAWRATKGFEFGLFKRRIAEMLHFKSLPWMRAVNACQSLQFTIAEAIKLAMEERDDLTFLKGAAPNSTLIVTKLPEPVPAESPAAPTASSSARADDTLILNQPAPERPVEASGGGAAPDLATQPAGRESAPRTIPVPASVQSPPAGLGEKGAASASPRVEPLPIPNVPKSPPPVIAGVDGAKPKSPWTKQPNEVDYKLDPHAGLAPLDFSERGVGFFWQRLSKGFIYVGCSGVFGTGTKAFSDTITQSAPLMNIFLDLTTPLLVTATIAAGGVVMRSYGDWKRRRGELRASQALY